MIKVGNKGPVGADAIITSGVAAPSGAPATPTKLDPFAGDGASKAPIGQGLKSLAVKVDSGAYRTDPLPLDNIKNTYTKSVVGQFIPDDWGNMFMTLLPGKGGSTGASDKRPRHLGLDLDRIAQQKIGTLVTLIEGFELNKYNVPELFEEAHKRGIKVEHFPIVDVNVPKADEIGAVRGLVQKLIGLMKDNESFVVHCAGGKGRTGTIAACVLVELGMDPTTAIKQTRIARKGTLETQSQEQYVHKYAAYVASQATPSA